MHQTDRWISHAADRDGRRTSGLDELAGLFSMPGLNPGDSIEWLIDRLAEKSDRQR